MYYLISRQEFRFNISASHAFGQKVTGMAYVRFAIMDDEKQKIYLRGLEQQLEMKSGEAVSSVKSRVISESYSSKSLSELVGHRLYIAVTVFEISSGLMEELEISNIKFVSSPYVIDLSRTISYFTPQLPFNVLVRVTYPDGSPANNVPVWLEGYDSFKTKEDGMVLLSMSPPSNTETFDIKVFAGDRTDGEIIEAQKKIQIYKSENKNYLHISLPPDVLDPERSLSADISAITAPNAGAVKCYYYLIISKGKVVKMGHVLKSELTKLTVPLSLEMVPSFRLVLYYFISVGGKTEMVANSAWIDVKDVCEAEIEINVDRNEYEPDSTAGITIQMGDAGQASLAMVDSAIYILNSKNKLTTKQLFERMNSYDLGCSFGGGVDNVHVFMDAGLAFISNNDASKLREGLSCKTQGRMKRSLDLQRQYMGKKRKKQRDLVHLMKQSCELKLNGEILSSAAGSNEDNYFDEMQVQVLSDFPHSTLWKTCRDLVKGQNRVEVIIPSSITTWEIQAVGMFKNKGFCIAEPKTLKVFKPMFVSFRLPYSVKRNEQLEVRVILHNYAPIDLQVKVYMNKVDTLCSPATGQLNARTVTVTSNSAYSIYFSIVPLAIGNIPITVFANAFEYDIFDAVRKQLKVVEEGVMKTEETSILVNSKSMSFYQIDEKVPTNMVPDTDAYLYIRARGEVMGDTVENSLDAEGIDKLISLPTGNVEVTSIKMAPAVYAIRYLDKSEQWISLKPERKDKALEFIESGYRRLVQYKRPDGSYGFWNDKPGSTWLTAFIAKIFSTVHNHIQIEHEYVQQAVLYVMQWQREPGYFVDDQPMWSNDMKGGVSGVEKQVSLTAFVIISFVNSLPSFQDNVPGKRQVEQSIYKAVNFLSSKVEDIKRPYVMAITSYALALVDKTSSIAMMAYERLKGFDTHDTENDTRHWKIDQEVLVNQKTWIGRARKAFAVEVEATAYALLAAVTMEDLQYANAIVRWLTEQRNYGGGFQSTQDTVVALEALSEYSIAHYSPQEIAMQFKFTSPGRSGSKIVKIERNNAQIQEQLKFPLGDVINVELTGIGNGTLTTLKTYQVIEETGNNCGYLRLEVTVQGKVEYTAETIYSEEQDAWEMMPADQPVSGINWFDLRSRRTKRQAPAEDIAKILYYKICYWHVADGVQDQRPSGMAIVDITMLSGFEPDGADLDKLSKLADRYIDSFEFKDGRVLLYLAQVATDKVCVIFGAKQVIPIGLIQPASATLYDYYNPQSRCTVYYNAPDQSNVVFKLCQDDVCVCAEGDCPQERKSKDVGDDERTNFACYGPIVDYAYIVNVTSGSVTGASHTYTTTITKIINVHGDEDVGVSDQRNYVKRRSCRLELKIGRSYLLMGKDGKTKDHQREMQYILESDSWVEEVPPAAICRLTRYRRICYKFYGFVDVHERFCMAGSRFCQTDQEKEAKVLKQTKAPRVERQDAGAWKGANHYQTESMSSTR
ncbi:complement C4-like [Amblyraja radiata]|uniref:complement C4-like n=1 Tax=Amblyraja radiata TaxID=386614 RepID=UPI00140320E4|nr:complement C4-like [Amblyraja radiata]